MKEQRFFICKHCGNLIGMIHESGALPSPVAATT